jgi:(heptosyl)LPS beta-1,4-glucosyltransferase
VEEVRQSSLQHASHEYVLFLDPDEAISSALAEDLKKQVAIGEYDYFVTPRQNYLLGKWVRHSRWWPDMQTRLFRQGKVTWGETLHAEPQVSGKGYTYASEEQWAIRHENYRTLDEYIEKNMRYAKADAQDRISAKQPLSLTEAIRLSVSEMMSRLFLDQGYKDGMHGLILSILQSFYYFMVYAYYWEGQKYAELETESSIKSFPRVWFSHGLAETLHWDKVASPLKNIKARLVRRMIA